MTKRIFNAPPLGEMTVPIGTLHTRRMPRAKEDPKPAEPKPRQERRMRPPKITDIPELPAYRVSTLGRVTPHQPKWQTEAMRSHRTPSLLWFTKGQGRITVAGVTRGFGPNNLVYLPTRTMYGYEPVGQIFGYAVHLPDRPELELPNEPLHMRFRDVTQQNELTGLIEALSDEIEGDMPHREHAMELRAGLIAIWLKRQQEQLPDDFDMTPDASRRLAAAFTALVEDEFREGHSVAHYAEELGVTPTHLSRACNVACDRPASALLADRVHFEARRMLRETDLPISTIAERLGFHSPAYFSRAFHKHTGQSPREFRQAPK